MKNQKTLKVLIYLTGIFGFLAGLEQVPGLPEGWTAAVAGGSAIIVAALVFVGDWLDNKKIDGSFKP